MKTSHVLLIFTGLAAPWAMAQSSAPSSDAPAADVQQAPPDIRSQPDTQNGAQSSGASSFDDRPAPAPMRKVEPRTINGVTVMCGGVGASEASMMKRRARDYDMMLTFATKRGEYLADVNVDIKDAKGHALLRTHCDGPIMLVDFPQGGTYRVHAETGGYSLNRTARISDKQDRTASVVMHWPQQIGQRTEVSTGDSGMGSNSGSDDSGGPLDPTEESK